MIRGAECPGFFFEHAAGRSSSVRTHLDGRNAGKGRKGKIHLRKKGLIRRRNASMPRSEHVRQLVQAGLAGVVVVVGLREVGEVALGRGPLHHEDGGSVTGPRRWHDSATAAWAGCPSEQAWWSFRDRVAQSEGASVPITASEQSVKCP